MENVMQTNLEQAIEIIRALPVEDYDKLREVLNTEETAKCQKNEKPYWRLERYKKARQWLNANSEKYMNQWVCLAHDLGEIWDETEEAKFEVDLESDVFYYAVETSLSSKLHTIAERRGVSVETLVNLWL